MNDITKTINNLTNPSTIEQEHLAKDEQQIGIFFSAFAIQFLLHKEMLQNKLSEPTFLKIFSDIETHVVQRVFIKNLLSNRKYLKIFESMSSNYFEFFHTPEKCSHPYITFLSRINKTFLIKQIFNHSGQVLERYKFISEFLNNQSIDFDLLHDKLWHLSTEQQILILSRIYCSLSDEMIDKKKSIGLSFHENILRLQNDFKQNPERYQAIQVSNLVILERFAKTLY